MAKKKIRVLLADNHAAARQALFSKLKSSSDIEIIDKASDIEAIYRMSRELAPDVILMDVSLPNINDLELTRTLHSEFPNVRIMGLSITMAITNNADNRARQSEAESSPESEDADLMEAASS